MDVGLAYLMTKSIVKVSEESSSKYSSTGTLNFPGKNSTPPDSSFRPRRGTIDALDLHSHKPKVNRHRRTPRTSLEHIAAKDLPSGSLDGLNSAKLNLIPILSKSKSDSNVNKTQRAREWLQAVNVDKTMAYIDNQYERVQVTKQQDVEQKRTNLLRRRASIQLKMDHMERQMKTKLKKTDSTGNKIGSKRNSGSSAALEVEIIRLKDELAKIESDLKAEVAKKDGSAKEMNLNRTKAIQVVQLLEAASEDLPEHGPNSPDNTKSPPKVVVSDSSTLADTEGQLASKSVDALPAAPKGTKELPSRQRGPSEARYKPKPSEPGPKQERHGSSLANQYLRRSKSRLKSLATSAMDLRRNKKGFDAGRPPVKRPEPDVGKSPPTTTRARSKSEGGASQWPAQAPSESASSPRTGRRSTEFKMELSSGASSEEDTETRTEISADTWNEIEAFEKLIDDHVQRHRLSADP